MEPKKKKILIITASSVLAVLLIVGGFIYYFFLSSQFHPEKTTYLLIYPKDNAAAVYKKIESKTNPGNIKAFYWLAKEFDYADHVRPGRYAIKRGDNCLMVFNKLYKGRQTPVDLTIG